MSKTKKEIKIEKMDDQSRRQFIRNVGFFLGTFSVSTLIRLETMEKISRKIFGSSTAFAQGLGQEDVLNFIIYYRGGAPLRNLVALQTDHNMTQHPDANIQYAVNQITNFTDTGGNPINLPAGSMVLSDYRTSIQSTNLFGSMGHTSALNAPVLNGGSKGNPLIWAAQQFGAPTLANSFAFYNGPTDDDMNSLPTALAAFHPEFHGSTASLTNKFKQLDLTTAQNNALTEDQRNQLYTLIQNKFSKDVARAIRESENQDVLKGSNEKALAALKVDYSQVLDPAMDGTGTLTSLRAGLGTRPQKMGGIDVVNAFYSFARGFENSVTNNYGLVNIDGGDWHGNNERQGENANAIQIQTMTYLAQSIRNILDSSGTFINPNTGNTAQTRVLVCSEFWRTPTINGTDNGDGGSNGLVALASDPSLMNGLKVGSFGGQDASTGQRQMVDNSGDTTSSTATFRRESLVQHVADFLGLDKDEAELTIDSGYQDVKNKLG